MKIFLLKILMKLMGATKRVVGMKAQMRPGQTLRTVSYMESLDHGIIFLHYNEDSASCDSFNYSKKEMILLRSDLVTLRSFLTAGK